MKFNAKVFILSNLVGLFRLFDWRFFACVFLASLNVYLMSLWAYNNERGLKIKHEIENATLILKDQEAFQDLFKLTTLDASEKVFDTTPLSEFSQIFNSLAAESSLQELSYTLEQKTVLPDVFEDGRTQKNAVHFKCHTKNDTAIYKFLFDLQHNFPGFIVVESVRIAQNPNDIPGNTYSFVGEITVIIINNAPREKNVTS